MAGVIGSEFLPHLDEGAMWVRGTLAPSTGPEESLAISNKARILLASFPEVTEVVDQIGRPDDGTDWTGFFNTEYFVNLKPKEEWRPVFHQNKDESDRRHESCNWRRSPASSGASRSPSKTTWKRPSAASRASCRSKSMATTSKRWKKRAMTSST